MKIVLISFSILSLFAYAAIGQSESGKPKADAARPASTANDPAALSKLTFEAHGGEKLKKMKTLVVKGSVDVTMSSQNIPGGFSTVISGDKYILDIQTPFQSLKQTFDGQNTVSTINGFTLPPVTSLGFPLLPRLGDAGFVVSALPESKKKAKGFRMTAPDGFYTDFFLDDKTNLIKSYESAYEVSGRSVTTSVEVDKYRIVDGVSVPEKYAQRFDLGQMTAYASFKAKDILINSPIEDSVFGAGK